MMTSAEGNKTHAAYSMRENLQSSATQWITRYVPGVFTRRVWLSRFIPRRWRPSKGILKGEIPVIEFILFDEADPVAIVRKEAERRRYVQLLGVGSWPSWASTTVDGLLLSEPNGWRHGYSQSHHALILSGQRGQISKATSGSEENASNWNLIFGLHARFAGLPTRWAIGAFLEGEHAQLSVIRDYAEGRVSRIFRSRRRRIRIALLTAGLDSRAVAERSKGLILPRMAPSFCSRRSLLTSHAKQRSRTNTRSVVA